MGNHNNPDLSALGDFIREAYHAGKEGVIWEGKKLVFRRKGNFIIVSPEKGEGPVGSFEVEKYISSKVLK